MKPSDIIKLLESDNSRLFKEETIRNHIDVEDFQKGLLLALDSMITFGVVKNIPVQTEDGPGLSFEEFKVLADKLRLRQLTGHAARDEIQRVANIATADEWNYWYSRILLKDLKCGTSEKTIANALKGTGHKFKVPVFTCMLAHDGAKHEKKIKGKCFLEYKYDGVRVVAIVQNGVATLHSRNGKIFNNFPHINMALSNTDLEGMVIDGEVMSENFQKLMTQVNRKSEVDTSDSYLAVFDMLPLEEFKKGKSSRKAIDRFVAMRETFNGYSDCIKPVDAHLTDLDTEDGQQFFKQFNKEAIDKGYEGLMIKPFDEVYTCKRSTAWLKMKPFIEVTLEIVALEEGTGKYEGMLGAIVGHGIDDGLEIKVNVGSGLSDKQREEIWAMQDETLGQLMEVRADAVTKSRDGDFYSLRFPRFKTFRGFTKGEKI
jgi:DNA ligase-1